jgi:exosortase A-associated hydrolase 2
VSPVNGTRNSRAADTARPHYLATPAGRLFAVHHAPAAPEGARLAVACCYPFGQEYLRAHRAFHQLAMRLARAGAHALRFDYHGSGDSGGDSHEGDLVRWRDDTVIATTALQAETRLPVALVGLRLGAALAALAAERRGDVDRLVLWEPVVHGRLYLDEIARAHRALLTDRKLDARTPAEQDGTAEVLGFPMSLTLRQTLEHLDLIAALPARPAASVLVLEHEPRPELDALSERLRALGARVDRARVPEPPIWERREMDQSVVPPRTLDHIVRWLQGGAP